MTDNVAAPGAGTIFATDDIGGVHYPKSKLAFGPNDTATDVRDDQPLPTRPRTTSAGNLSAQTNAAGANWQAFGNQACHELIVVNNSGTAIEVRQGGAGVALPIPDKAAFPFSGLTNASNLEVRRVDQSNAQATVHGRWNA